MSTILKALRRLESERTPPERSLRDQVLRPPRSAPRARPRGRRALPIVLAAGFALVVGGGLAAVWPLLFAGEARHSSEPAGAAAPESAAPAAERPLAALPPERRASPIPDAPAPPAEPAPAAGRPLAAPIRIAEPQAAPLAAEPDPFEEAEPAEDLEPVAVVRLGGPPVPDVRITQTRWHPSPERRVALVRLPGEKASRELREGEAVAGLEVVRIEPSGVLFRHGDTEVRRRVSGEP
jgi:hypothetical protein